MATPAIQDRDYVSIPGLDPALQGEIGKMQSTAAQSSPENYQNRFLGKADEINKTKEESPFVMQGPMFKDALEKRISTEKSRAYNDLKNTSKLDSYTDTAGQIERARAHTMNAQQAAQNRSLMAQEYQLKRKQYAIDMERIRQQQEMQRKSIIGSIAGIAGVGAGLALTGGAASGALIGGSVGGLGAAALA